ncbi:MAG: 4Fe-4S dicluster domain-containing protein [Alphaproteobacteria bacterium]|uniref:4Fe-4S dicluster domain-containing protein n=1 Tax=Candidatus Nitrobium versatile TaxID=2884831 RepID=A0A953J4H1_9BACT|nr:4Fe-4S dicluster domain-containing protein [Candidatus Nitrobium versatile]
MGMETKEREETLLAQKALPWVIPAQCEGCAECVNACPVHGLDMWETENEGIFIPWLSNPDACIGCGKCERACTWGAVSLTSYVEDARVRFLTKRPHGLLMADERKKFNLREVASRKIAIMLCMDCRLNIEEILQQNRDNAYILRNAGLLIDNSELRSLAFSSELFKVREILLVGHRDCRIREANIRVMADELEKKLCHADGSTDRKSLKALLKSFRDPEANVRKQAEVIRRSGLFPEDLPISGVMYEEFTGNIFKLF